MQSVALIAVVLSAERVGYSRIRPFQGIPGFEPQSTSSTLADSRGLQRC